MSRANSTGDEIPPSTETLLQSHLDNISTPVAYLDTGFNFIRVNRAYAATDKREPRFYPGKNHFVLYPDEQNLRIFQRVANTGKTCATDHKLFEYAEHPERGIIHWDWELNPIRDEGGAVQGLVLTMKDVTDRVLAQEAISRSLIDQEIMASILHLALQPLPLNEILRQALVLALQKQGLGFDPKGVIFLRDPEKDELVMTVMHGLPDQILSSCERVRRGECLCGLVLERKQLIFSDCINHDHHITYTGISPHGHYCVPIKTKDEMLGVLNLYVPEGHRKTREDEQFVTAIADTLAGVILRHRATAALEESEQRFRSIAETARDAIISIDTSGNIVSWNSGAQHIFGYTSDEVTGLPLITIMPERYRARHQVAVENWLNTGVPQFSDAAVVEVAGLRKDGTEVPLEISISTWNLHDRHHVTGILRDISDRKQAEQALRKASLFSELIISESPVGISIYDASGKCVAANRSLAVYIGATVEQVLAQNFYHIESWEKYGLLDKAKRVLQENTQQHHAVKLTTSFGKDVAIDCYFAPLIVDDEKYLLFTLTDITERKKAEEALFRSEEKYRLLVENMPAMLYSFSDKSGGLVYSPRVREVLGYSAEHLAENPYLWHDSIHADDVRKVNEAIVSLRAGKSFNLDYRISDSDGNWHCFNDRCIAMQAQEDEVIIYGIAVDITDRVNAEQQVRALNTELEQRIEQRTRELSEALDAAKSVDRAKSDFLANMSHEIRTPLNAVLGLAEIGFRDSRENSSRRHFNQIIESGAHLLEVINDILDFSRIEVGRIAIEARPFQLITTVEEAAGMMQERAHAKGLHLDLNIAGKMPALVEGDSMRLKQILLNLLSNAIKFTPQGQVSFSVTRDGDVTSFRVADSGIGMNEEQLSRLFTAFEQADKSTTRKYGGSGLGLAISRNLAGLMGGEIRVESRAGQGSIFTLVLPLPAIQAHADNAAVASWRPDGAQLPGLRVLAAEDIEVNRLILQDLLEHEGAQVVFAEDGQQCLDLLQQFGAASFDVVLMDLQMPILDGYDAARHIRNMAPGLPIIGLTAHALIEVREKCLAVGMVDHVTKPIDADVLITTILRHVEPASASS